MSLDLEWFLLIVTSLDMLRSMKEEALKRNHVLTRKYIAMQRKRRLSCSPMKMFSLSLLLSFFLYFSTSFILSFLLSFFLPFSTSFILSFPDYVVPSFLRVCCHSPNEKCTKINFSVRILHVSMQTTLADYCESCMVEQARNENSSHLKACDTKC